MPSAKKADLQLEQLRAELAEMESLAKRVQADFTNYRRRAEEDRSLLREIATEEVVKKLLPVIDNFDRALGQTDNVPADLRENEWVKGVLAIEQQFKQVLSELGMERISAVWGSFDAARHEAVAHSNDPEKGDAQITEEFESGWKLGERVIRPAKVRVNRKE